MRMRRKKWAREELAECAYFAARPEEMRGRWREVLPGGRMLCLELGCGKGVSTARMIAENREANFLAMDINTDVLGVARRNIEAACRGVPDNAMLLRGNIEQIEYFFAPEDRIERLYISFPNPWNQRAKQHKRRLVHARQLMKYRDFLAEGAKVYFKTDDDALFLASHRYLAEAGFVIEYETKDLHKSGFSPNYVSEHEALYTARGVPVKFLIARKDELPGEASGGKGIEDEERV